MKRILLACSLFCCCTQKSPEELENWKAFTVQQSQQRVDDIIRQLKEGCDSSLLQTARYKVDSIKRKMTGIARPEK